MFDGSLEGRLRLAQSKDVPPETKYQAPLMGTSTWREQLCAAREHAGVQSGRIHVVRP
jgi:hypothetical protein